jgi:hypothetical protein
LSRLSNDGDVDYTVLYRKRIVVYTVPHDTGRTVLYMVVYTLSLMIRDVNCCLYWPPRYGAYIVVYIVPHDTGRTWLSIHCPSSYGTYIVAYTVTHNTGRTMLSLLYLA